MAIKAKKSTIIRLLGSIFIFLGLILSLLLKIVFFENIIAFVLWFVILFPWILGAMLLKLSFSFVIKNLKIHIVFLIFLSTIIFMITIFWDLSFTLILSYYFSLNLLLLNSWYFSLSIYKKKKMIFLFSGIAYILGNIFLDLQFKPLGGIISIITVGAGMILILIVEYNMYKKGYLRYI